MRNMFKFLKGYTNAEGILYDEFELRSMTGKDEEYVAKNAKINPSKLMKGLLMRCTLSIGEYTPKSPEWESIFDELYTGDLDYMLIKLRVLSVGEEFKIGVKCPECKNTLESYVTEDDLTVLPYVADSLPFTLPVGYEDKKGEVHKEGILRISKGIDRELITPIALKNAPQGLSMMYARLVTFDDGLNISPDVISSLSLKDRNYLRETLEDIDFGIDSKITLTCPECGEEFITTFSPQNFF